MLRKKSLVSLTLCILIVLTAVSSVFAATLPGSFKITSPKTLSTYSYASSISVTWTTSSGAGTYKIAMRDLNTDKLVYNSVTIGNVKSYTIPSSKLIQSHKYRIAIGAYTASSSTSGTWVSIDPIYVSSSKYSKISEYVADYGQFAYKDNSDATITIDPLWKNDNIVTMSVTGIPKITSVTIHKNAKAMFNTAFDKIRTTQVKVDSKGTKKYLKDLITTYDGTFVSRHKNWDKNQGLSNHSWGTAIDINASTHTGKIDSSKKPYDPNYLIYKYAFSPAGFYWGNTYSDSMHYESVNR